MKRINIYFPDKYVDYLKFRKDSSLSEHIRYATAQYIHRLMQEEDKVSRNASASASKRKEDE